MLKRDSFMPKEQFRFRRGGEMSFEQFISKIEIQSEASAFEKENYEALRKHRGTDFAKFVRILKTTPDGDAKSTVSYEENAEQHTVSTNKPEKYFSPFIGKTVYIAGAEYAGQSGMDSWLVLCCHEASLGEDSADEMQRLTEEERRVFERKAAYFDPGMRKDLIHKAAALADVPKKKSELPAIYRTLEELDILYETVRPAMPPEYQAEYESCRRMMEQNPGKSEKQNLFKVMRNILEMDWIRQLPKEIDVEEAIASIRREHIGHDAQIESIRAEMLASNLNGKGPVTINFVGRNGGSSLASSIANALDRPYAEVDLSGDTGDNNDRLQGSSRIYENGKEGLLWQKLSKAGPYGVIVFKHIDRYESSVLELLQGIISKNGFEDGFMQMHMDVSHMWIICTSSSIKDLPMSIRNNTNEIFLPDLTEEEVLRLINQKYLPTYCKEYGMECTCRIPEEVAEKLIYQVSNNDMHRLKSTVRSLVVRAMSDGKKKFPSLTLDNLGRYCRHYSDDGILKSGYEAEPTRMERKFFACYGDYCEEFRKRELELLDVMHYGTDEREKDYAVSASRYLVNIFAGDIPPYKVGRIREEMQKTHYGFERFAELLEDAVLAHELGKGQSGMIAIGLHGGPGTGKTTSGESIARALGRDFIKISLGGMNDSQTIKGTGRVYANASPGIIIRELAKSGKSLSSVVLLDELDKMGAGSAGNPFDPLHELLDPTQPCYYDEYLECNVPKNNLVILLAFNDISRIPDAIRDRMRVVRCDSYSAYDKKQILENYISVKIAKKYGLEKIAITEDAQDMLVHEYSITPGVRDIEKDLERIVVRSARLNGGRFQDSFVSVGISDVRDALGGSRLRGLNDVPSGEAVRPGQALALAVSGNLGTCFAIQTMINKHQDERVKITGLPKGSCRESITDAVYLAGKFLGKKLPKLYIHMTDSGVKKDGPSAGLTLFCSIMSCMLDRPLPNAAFTGTIDVLYGTVGMVGGVEEKITAAERKGVEKVYIPSENYEELKEKKKIGRYKPEIIPVRNLTEIMKDLFGIEERG